MYSCNILENIWDSYTNIHKYNKIKIYKQKIGENMN